MFWASQAVRRASPAAAQAFTADPAERFGYGLQLFLDGIRQQLTLLPSAGARGRAG
jgi:hypothetical protein